ncbi:helix-turn-helix domain-containing protein [Streptomyces klenkii]|uniref:Helix-turn-helix domain-containing protein n=1 Tax=Streptomyces klenkii TaxID=1420899 RepID=A0A3B0AUT3_9ACTN|nr:helix-turn-helix transcriptional regulator [Streptomyces klenkii]RKN64268.1 helix-turn-helix domain-containing protein [Streptomyces klenkii]
MASEFSTLLRRLRHDAGMTQETLAERARVGVRTIRGLETGERADPRVTTVRLLADALGLGPVEREELLAAAVRRTGDGARPDDSAARDETAVRDGPVGPGGLVETGRSASPAGPATGQPASALRETLADVAEQLAHAVAARWQREEEQRQVHDPYPLPVRWQPVPEELTDHWANIRRLPAGGEHGPLDLSGQLDAIVGVYRRVPSGRLVVLGRPGSGKTILTMRFVLDYLTSRARTEAVPVIFSIGGWDPTAITFRDWLTVQLTRDHPGLAAPAPGGLSLAAALVETGRVLPVLDGFDEIAGGLHRPALEALNATTLPLLLTSRPAEYAAAVAETDVLTSAAAVELADLTLSDLADYLPRATRKARGGDPMTTAWDPVLKELSGQPRSRAGAGLAAVLSTPLMVTLARAVYSDTPGRDPAALLDTRRFAGPEELEDHLLDKFTASAYRHRPGHRPAGGSRRGFDPERAQYWLGYLAHHLTRLDTPDLEWWRFGSGLPRFTRTLVTALMIFLSMGLVHVVVGAFFDSLGFLLAEGLVVAAVSGVMFGIVYWFMVAAKDVAVQPSNMGMKIFDGARGTAWRGTAARCLIGLLLGLFLGFGYGFLQAGIVAVLHLVGLAATLRVSLANGAFFGIVFALAAGPVFGLVALLETPLDIRSAVSPAGLLRTNRRTITAQFIVWSPLFGLLVGYAAGAMVRPLSPFLGPLVWNVPSSIKLGLISGIGGGLGYGFSLSAWGQWAVFARIWLPLTGRLPWNVAAFLQDAYQRGVLRQAGAVYQFRHARLQAHLARTYRASRARGRQPAGPGGAAPAR